MQTPAPTRRDLHGKCPQAEKRRSAGFTLIVVVWVLALILLLGTAVTVGVRYRTRVDTNLLNVRRAELAAESAINFAILLRLAKKEAPPFPLERVSGITPELFRAALPLVTVGTGRIEPDPAAASDALRQMLGLRTNATNTTAPAQNTGDITIRADVSAGGYVRFIREALVSLR